MKGFISIGAYILSLVATLNRMWGLCSYLFHFRKLPVLISLFFRSPPSPKLHLGMAIPRSSQSHSQTSLSWYLPKIVNVSQKSLCLRPTHLPNYPDSTSWCPLDSCRNDRNLLESAGMGPESSGMGPEFLHSCRNGIGICRNGMDSAGMGHHCLFWSTP